MDKGKIRVALAALSVVGLLAGLTMTGCKTAGSCGSSCGSMMQPAGGHSSSAGSTGETKPAETPPEAPH